MGETSATAPASRLRSRIVGPHDLQGILAPINVHEFLKRCYGRSFKYVPGEPGKFGKLLPWSALNRILEEHRLEPPRLRLTREGKPVPATSFLRYQANRRKSGQPVPRLLPTELIRQLREGATLVLDAVDELQRPIRSLAESLERTFGVRIQVNAYAGWRTSHGFDLHWDDHDVFILQVAGKKQWKIYGMTRRYPLARDIEPAANPAESPLWEGLLNDGDLLYIPRGWWHVATPLDEPTLHLTVGVNNPTGADLLGWLVDRLKASEDVRCDLPQFGGPEEQTDYVERLRNALLEAWHPDLLQQYLNEMRAKSPSRPHMALPWAPTVDLLPPENVPFTVKWTATRAGSLHQEQGAVTIAARGRRWRFAPAAEPILHLLMSGDECSMEEFRECSGMTSSTVRAFVRELLENGLVTISSGSEAVS